MKAILSPQVLLPLLEERVEDARSFDFPVFWKDKEFNLDQARSQVESNQAGICHRKHTTAEEMRT